MNSEPNAFTLLLAIGDRLTGIEMMAEGLKRMADPSYGAAFAEVAQDTARHLAQLREILLAEARLQRTAP